MFDEGIPDFEVKVLGSRHVQAHQNRGDKYQGGMPNTDHEQGGQRDFSCAYEASD